MNGRTSKYYLLNCLLLMLPIAVWNIMLTPKLPAAFQPAIFWNGIPPALAFTENASRLAIFLLTCLMPLSIKTPAQKAGLALYITGTLLYITSWFVLMHFPALAENVLVFLAPAYTPLLWLTGITLIGNSFYFHLPFRRWIFIGVSLLFLVCHNMHTLIIFDRLYTM